jgi:hypothetical protein
MNTSAGIHSQHHAHPGDPRDTLSVLEQAATVWSAFAWAGFLYASALLVSGCSVGIEPAGGKYYTPLGSCPYPAVEMGMVAALTEQEFYRVTGHDVAGWTDDVSVECVPHLMETDSGLASGLTTGPRTVRISTYGGDLPGLWPLRYTALSHELTHVLLIRLTGNGDAEHDDPGVWEIERTVRVRQFGEEKMGCCLDPLAD